MKRLNDFESLCLILTDQKIQEGNDQETTQSEKDSHSKKVQVGKDQEKAQSEKDSHSKNRGGKKPNQQSGT